MAKAAVGQNSDEVRRCLDEAETYAEDDWDRIEVAGAWMTLLADVDRGKAVFPAPRDTEDVYIQVRKLQEYHKLFGGDLRSGFRSIETTCTRASHFSTLAWMWRSTVGDSDPQEYRRWMTLAEKHATCSCSWRCCASEWRETGDTDRAIACIRKAEASAKDYPDWWGCGKEWAEVSVERYRDDVIRCFKQAEGLCRTTDSMLNMAVAWKKHLEENHYGRLIPQAERLATSARDWRQCAVSWLLESSDHDAYKRCMNTASGIAT